MSIIYNNAKAKIASNIDLELDDIRVMLLKNSYVADATHVYVSEVDPVANEIEGTNYTRKELANKAVTKNDVTNIASFTANATTWSGLNAGTIYGIIIYKHINANDAYNELIVYVTSNNLPLITNGSDVTINWDTEGILNFA